LEAYADFARLLDERHQLDIVVGARVMLLGRAIRRRPMRHYVGRVFATAASLTLGLPIYDTQCGAKLFRVSSRLRRVLAQPFTATWAFDVELIARFGSLGGRYSADALRDLVYELPLNEWTDVSGSKVRPRDFVRAMVDLGRIRFDYVRRGAVRRPTPAGLPSSHQP
jgi:hypothetical protein